MAETDTMLRHAVRAGEGFRLKTLGDDVPPGAADLTSPFAVVGRSSEADLMLPDRTVSLRHLYVQPLNGLVYACDLFSANGTRVGGRAFTSGWVAEDESVTVGPYEVAVGGGGPPGDAPAPDEYKPRGEVHDFYGPLPRISLELMGHSKKAVWPLNRALTLLGRDDRCRITCGHESVSAVHCGLLLTRSGLWAVDLVSRTGIRINGEDKRCGLLSDGFELTVGKYRLRTHVEDTPSPPVTSPGDGSGVSGPSVDFLTKGHRIFRVETDGTDAVVVCPMGDQTQFPYQEIQTEANTVVHVIANRGFRHAVVDFSRVRVVNSIIVESVAGFCRSAPGKAVLCGATPEMYSVLEDMKLPTIWPHYLTREDALAAVRFEG